MNLAEAKHLRTGQYIYSKTKRNSDGTAMRARVTSVKTWKTRPLEVEVHYKRGMYEYGTFKASELGEITTHEPPRVKPALLKRRR